MTTKILTMSEAREIASEDPSLVYLEVEVLEYVDIVNAESLGLGPDDIAPIICAMQEYIDEHEGEALSISVVAARGDEAAGTYLRSANGQLRDDSLSAPDDVRRLTEAAWLAALETMSEVREVES